MIKWCSYCQQYLGEFEPWQDYSVSHGICPPCYVKLKKEGDVFYNKAQQLSELYDRLRSAARCGTPISYTKIITEARELNIKPLDLMIGMIQPILHEIGVLWAAGEISVAREHQFSDFADSLVAAMYLHYPELDTFRQSVSPRFLLVNADGNYHTLGLQLVALSLATRKIPHRVVLPGLPAGEIVSLIQEHKPRAVGISVALPTHMKGVRELLGALRQSDPDPTPSVYVGGMPVREGLSLPEEFGVTLCKSIFDLTV